MNDQSALQPRTPPDKDLGIIAVLLKRFESERLPEILSLRKTVESGEVLSDVDLEYLDRLIEDARRSHLSPLLERHPEYRSLAAAVASAYGKIIERDLENERLVSRSQA